MPVDSLQSEDKITRTFKFYLTRIKTKLFVLAWYSGDGHCHSKCTCGIFKSNMPSILRIYSIYGGCNKDVRILVVFHIVRNE